MKTRSSGLSSPGDTDRSAYSDEQLVLEALHDSHLAFEQLIKQYQHRILRTIASIVSDEQAAQDVAQETFLSAWSDLAKLKEREKFGRWLNRIAINLSKDWLRDQRKHNENRVPLDEDAIVPPQDLSYQRAKLRQGIWEAIDELAENYREVVILHYISGYSYKEISDMLSIPFSTIVGRLQEARNQLRKEFLDMVTQLELEIDSTVHKFLKEHAKQNGISVEGLIIRLIERYKREMDSPEIGVRKIPHQASSFGRPSPDGRYLSGVNWETFNLKVQDLTTGEIRDVTNDGKSGKVPHRCAGKSTWSPDGKRIAYAWYNEGHNELRIVGLNGGKPRVLWKEDGNLLDIAPDDWSPDGRFISGMSHKMDGTTEILLISVADGSIRTLKSEPGRRSVNRVGPGPVFSPDGRYVVYTSHVKEYGHTGIFLMPTDGSGEEVSIVARPEGSDLYALWAPDGRTLIFVSHRDSLNATSLWFTQMANGKPVAEPQLIRKESGDIRPLGFTREGSLYYNIWYYGRSDIYTASLDMETGEVLTPLRLLRSDSHNSSPTWSPDGKWLAYLSVQFTPERGRSQAIVAQFVETGEEREIIPRVGLNQFSSNIYWSPDGRHILLYGGYSEPLRVLNCGTREIDTIVEPYRIRIWSPEWSPDGKTIFYIRQRTEKGDWPCAIVARDLTTGRERELCPGGIGYSKLAVSPDGGTLAFVDGREHKKTCIKVVSAAGGEARELHQSGRPLLWTSDGRHLLFTKQRPSPDSSRRQPEVWRIPAEGGEPEKLWEIREPFESLAWEVSFHPDGQRIAYSKRSGGGIYQTETWAMENLLTAFAPDKRG